MDSVTQEQREKLERLKHYFRELGSVAVAFSGGVDSSFLLKVAFEELGETCIAVTIRSDSFPERERREAEDFCRQEGIRQILIGVDEMKIEGFCENPPNRCYLCKRELFQRIRRTAEKEGIEFIAEGSNLDDMGDYRPGLQAVAELGIKSPLRACGLTKQDIRALSKEMDLPTWKKPSFACLASRFVYGETITREKLKMVEKAEQMLLDHGFRQVRVRIHDRMARIEILPEEFGKLMKEDTRKEVYQRLKAIGFSYVTLDLCGYRTGSMNEVL